MKSINIQYKYFILSEWREPDKNEGDLQYHEEKVAYSSVYFTCIYYDGAIYGKYNVCDVSSR